MKIIGKTLDSSPNTYHQASINTIFKNKKQSLDMLVLKGKYNNVSVNASQREGEREREREREGEGLVNKDRPRERVQGDS